MNYRKKIYKQEEIAERAHNKLINDKQEDIATFELLEAYVTQRISVYKEGYRSETLAGIQKKITETNKFVDFLKTI